MTVICIDRTVLVNNFTRRYLCSEFSQNLQAGS